MVIIPGVGGALVCFAVVEEGVVVVEVVGLVIAVRALVGAVGAMARDFELQETSATRQCP